MRAILLGFGVAALLAAAPVQAAGVPKYVTAAVANPDRPDTDTKRDADRKPADMVMFAGIKPGDVVVDLIPGRGYFTRIFAGAVGPKGRVYGFYPSELDDTFKKFNMTVPSGTDPKYRNVFYLHSPVAKFVVPEQADVIWTSQNYHDMHDPFMGPQDMAVVNKAIYAALKPGGIYIVLDHAAAAGSGARDTDTLHRIDPAVVKQEVLAAGFRFVSEDTILRNPNDAHDKAVFDASLRGHTDQFIFKFQKPR